MSEKATCQHVYLIEQDADPVIIVGFHVYESRNGNGRKKKNVCFNITPKGAEFEIEVSMPERDFKKLIAAGMKFLDSKESTHFYKDEFRVGEKVYPAADALRELSV